MKCELKRRTWDGRTWQCGREATVKVLVGGGVVSMCGMHARGKERAVSDEGEEVDK